MKNKSIVVIIAVVSLLVGMLIVVVGFKFLGKVSETVISRREVVDEESVVIRLVELSTESVVTISMVKTQAVAFDVVSSERDIGTGFIISSDGLIVTNKHVVADVSAKYKVIIGKDTMTDVVNIYRDPISDLAIVKVEKTGLKPVVMGDSDKIKVGQTVIAIGTALGEFRSTVTRGVVSGLGRGITAGSSIEGSERLENVIQTDAAINPGNLVDLVQLCLRSSRVNGGKSAQGLVLLYL
jgi:S1-C subfamily serine protease